MAEKTPREEFEQMFGGIIDEQWQWLKEFVEKNHIPQPPVGFRVNGRVYHPDDVKAFVEIDGQFFPHESGGGDRPMIPDERWENIKAYMGPKKEYRGSEFDEGVNLEDWYEITFELTYDGMYYWNFQVIHKLDWESFSDPEIICLILDQMVDMMDDRLESHESGAETAPA